ncbi:MAG TPA: SUMF1/EgtB/PvdO family nonheme iron enzyme, partial [Thermodesulfovibrionia bacterium]|nr:SUMF1/EgtB/PvdO family nonheme iron enzyme [Thermodesulfovibrionia bacterium]
MDSTELILKVISITVVFIGLILSILGMPKVYDIWKGWRDRKILKKKLSKGPFDEHVIERATQYFIKPQCQDHDPAQEVEIRHTLYALRDSLFKAVDKFIETDTPVHHLMLLADSGTGKTTFVLNYYARNERKWKKKFHVGVVALGHPEAERFISDLTKEEPEKTVLFLDAFDEDTRAIDNHYRRIADLLNLCRDFKRVIITCRTQFFRKEEEIPVDTGIVRFGPRAAGEEGTYKFRKLYIAPFENKDVKKYLSKRYPLWRYFARRKAQDIAINKIPLLSVRPMLLSHIPEIVKYKKEITYPYELYEIMVEAWLVRESVWVDKDLLREYSERLALEIWFNRQKRNTERVPCEELTELAKSWRLKLTNWQLSGRSLLNRDAEGNFKFAHRSIMEYLFVKRFLQLPLVERLKVEWTELMKSFLVEKLRHGTAGENLQRVDLSFMHLRKTDLKDVDLTEANIDWSNIENSLKMKFAYIPPGKFMMGSTNVTLSQGFFMQTTPVTQGQWKALMGNNPSRFKRCGDDCPVESVSWHDAQKFIEKLNKREGVNKYRLPTEAEWEYAARAGSDTAYCFGDDEARLSEYAWYDKNSDGRTHPVAKKKPNAWWLYDMHGNVWEWSEDWYGDYPTG